MTYTPKSGDSVKATLGETTICGTYMVGAIDSRAVRLEEGPVVPLSDAMNKWDWTFEPWVKPVTFKPLAVVRLHADAPEAINVESYDTDEDREPWSHESIVYRVDNGDWYDLTEGWDFADIHIARALAHGKAEILFEGVDE